MVNRSLSLALYIAVSSGREGGAGADGPDPAVGSHRQIGELPAVDGLPRAFATSIKIGCTLMVQATGRDPSHPQDHPQSYTQGRGGEPHLPPSAVRPRPADWHLSLSKGQWRVTRCTRGLRFGALQRHDRHPWQADHDFDG
jgi:hypothetical protein